MTSNQSITPEELPLIEKLNRFATRPDVLAALRRALADAVKKLQESPDLAATFVSLDPARLGGGVPASIGTVRVAVTRDGADVERHPNSRQYLFALDGPMETHVETEQGWRIDRFGNGDPAVLEHRWHVVPTGVWHKSLSPGRRNWGVVAFHTAKHVADEHR